MSRLLYTPKQAAQELNIASSTLRLWAAKFSSVLSSHANPPKAPSGRASRRSYNDQDLRTLARAKELLGDNLAFAQVLIILQTEPLPEPEPTPPEETALAIPNELLSLAHLAIDQRERLDELDRRLAELEKSRPPWWSRLFGR